MGADGHIICVKRAEWDAANPDVKPTDIGLYTGTILGVEAAWGYAGDNMFDWKNYGSEFDLTWEGNGLGKATSAVVEKRKAALEWFDKHAEWHEVWT